MAQHPFRAPLQPLHLGIEGHAKPRRPVVRLDQVARPLQHLIRRGSLGQRHSPHEREAELAGRRAEGAGEDRAQQTTIDLTIDAAAVGTLREEGAYLTPRDLLRR